jgi:hypothetical protein
MVTGGLTPSPACIQLLASVLVSVTLGVVLTPEFVPVFPVGEAVSSPEYWATHSTAVSIEVKFTVIILEALVPEDTALYSVLWPTGSSAMFVYVLPIVSVMDEMLAAEVFAT